MMDVIKSKQVDWVKELLAFLISDFPKQSCYQMHKRSNLFYIKKHKITNKLNKINLMLSNFVHILRKIELVKIVRKTIILLSFISAFAKI